jgi:maltose alpha-D-glucosyltransferase / alpha-amylase
VLAQPSADPAFAPVTGTADTAATFAQRALEQLSAAYRAIDTVEDSNRHALDSAREALFAKLDSLAHRVDGAMLTRIHGDMHLGQVLVCNGDVIIIDFEGEPGKPVDVRRSKDHPLRDVAGMIRSFDYAAAVVRRRSQASHAHLTDEQVSALLDSFVQSATRAFLDGYRTAIAPEGEQMPPDNSELLDLFLMEKAAYEVVYEAANRPTWIDVPLHGMADCARRLLGVETFA